MSATVDMELDKALKRISDVTDSITLCATGLSMSFSKEMSAVHDTVADVNKSLNSLITTFKGALDKLTDFKNLETLDNNDELEKHDNLNDIVSGSSKIETDVLPSANFENAPKLTSAISAALQPIQAILESSKGIQENNFNLIKEFSEDYSKKANQEAVNKLLKPETPALSNSIKEKKEKTSLMFDSVSLGKEIAHGITGTLSALLNPIALITAFIVKFAPYIMLGLAFLYGVWQALSEDIKKKISIFGKIVLPIILGVLVLWKGIIPALISSVSMAIKIASIRTRIIEHKAIMAIYAKEAANKTEEHVLELGHHRTKSLFTIIEHGWAKIRHLFEMVCTKIKLAFDITCNITKVIMAAAAIAIIIGLVILLVGGIFLVMTALSAGIKKATTTIISEFMRIGQEIKEMVNSIIDPITAVLTGLMQEMRQLFADVKYGDESDIRRDNNTRLEKERENKQRAGIIPGEIAIKDGVTSQDFHTVVNAITAPLNTMVIELGTMIALQTAQLMATNPVSTIVMGAMGAVTTGLISSHFNNTATTTDNSQTNIVRDKDNKNETSAPYDGFETDFKNVAEQLNKLMQKLEPYKHFDPVFSSTEKRG